MSFKTLQLAKGKERALQRRHPWVFSGAFKKIPRELNNGDVVEVIDHKGNLQGVGFFRKGSIAVSLLSFEGIESIETLLKQRLKEAVAYRKAVGNFDLHETNCYRQVFAEGDGLSGLIIDKYGDTAVVQIHHPGWVPYLTFIAETLVKMELAKHVYSKPAVKLQVNDDLQGTLAGEPSANVVKEYGHKFLIDWEKGQKTGFFLDQRENRKLLARYAKGRSVLNTFCYTGGFSVYALAAGATKVVSTDISEPAVELTNKNVTLNGLEQNHTAITADTFEFFKSEKEQFEVVILDPPAFSKNRRSVHNAVQAYKRLNLAGIKHTRKGGFLFTFSCSQHVDFKLFQDTIRAAAIESGRAIRVVERLTQPTDHPVNLYFPEGEYLKGLVLEIN